MKKYGLIEICNEEISERLSFEDIWWEYVFIIKDNHSIETVYFKKGDLRKLQRGEIVKHYFEEKVVLNTNYLSLKRNENRTYKFFIFPSTSESIKTVFSDMEKMDTIHGATLNFLRASVNDIDESLLESFYDSVNEDKIVLNLDEITEEEFLKEFELNDFDLEWENVRKYCEKLKITPGMVMGSLTNCDCEENV